MEYMEETTQLRTELSASRALNASRYSTTNFEPANYELSSLLNYELQPELSRVSHS